MNQPQSPYSAKTDPMVWTRVDMLLSLYSAAIEHIDSAVQTSNDNQAGQAAVHRTRAAALVTAIRSGLDPEHGEVPVKVDQLCEFVQFCLSEGDVERMHSAANVLRELHAGFLGVREDAVQREQAGEIPALPTDSAINASV